MSPLVALASPRALACKICSRASASRALSSSSTKLGSCSSSSEKGCEPKPGPQRRRLALCAILWHSLLSRSTCVERAGVVCLQAGEGLTALRFSDSGLQCAVGTQNGLVALYDLRSSRPSIVKDHNYGAPIKDIKFHTSGNMAGGRTHDNHRTRAVPGFMSWANASHEVQRRSAAAVQLGLS